MNIFEAVRELLENRAQEYLHPDDRAMLEDALNERPAVVCNISGGLLQGASANMPVDVYTLDFDIDSFDDDLTGVMVDGSPAYFGEQSADVDPQFVAAMIEADEVYLKDGSPVDA